MELPADAVFMVHDNLSLTSLGRLANVSHLASIQSTLSVTRRLRSPHKLDQHELRCVVEEWKIDSGQMRRRKPKLPSRLRGIFFPMLNRPWESSLCRKLRTGWSTVHGLGGGDSLQQLGTVLETMRSSRIPRVCTCIDGFIVDYPKPSCQRELISFPWGIWTIAIGGGVPTAEDGCIELAMLNTISGTILVATAESNGWVNFRPPACEEELVYYGHWAEGFTQEEERRAADAPVLSKTVQAQLFAQLEAAEPLPEAPENLHISWQEETIQDDQTWWHVIPAQDQDVLYVVCCSGMQMTACEVMAIHKRHNRVRCHYLRLGEMESHRELGDFEWPTGSTCNANGEHSASPHSGLSDSSISYTTVR